MKYQPNRLGTMIDCSRNAVASVESVKKVDRPDVKALATTLSCCILRTHMRCPENRTLDICVDRYSREELRGLDAYAKTKIWN